MTPETPIDRLPPHSLEFEQVVLGGLLSDSRVAYPIAAEVIGPDSSAFYDLRHSTLYEAIVQMVGDNVPIDAITVYEQLRRAGKAEMVGGAAYLMTLSAACPSPSGVGYFADILVDYQRKRQLIAMGAGMVAGAYEPSSNSEGLLAEATRNVMGLAKNARKGTANIKTLVMEAINRIESCHQNQGRIEGLPTGFADLDKMTNGLQNGEMIVIAARPSMGKTSLAMNIAEHVAVDAGCPVGVFSLEMTAESLTLRMLCSRARVNLRSVRDGYLAERDFPKISAAAGRISNSPIYIDDTPGLSVFELRARAHGMKDRHGIRLLVIDYIQLMRATMRKSGNRETEVAEISSGVKSIAKELSIPVIAISQLNRDMEREKNRRPRLSDLRESGAIEQDADLVGMLWNPASKDTDCDEEEGEICSISLSIAKQRNGPTGEVLLTFLKCYTRFENAARVSRQDLPSYDTD